MPTQIPYDEAYSTNPDDDSKQVKNPRIEKPQTEDVVQKKADSAQRTQLEADFIEAALLFAGAEQETRYKHRFEECARALQDWRIAHKSPVS